MKSRVYIKTTIPSYLTAAPTADPVRAFNQLLTLQWWDIRRQDFELCVAQPVLDECGDGDPDAARMRLDVLRDATMLELTLGALELADEIVVAGALPPKVATDATHIAVAAANSVQYLLTWNCKHIANPALWPTLGRLCDRRGLKLPVIVTPAQFLEPLP